ncbi:UvrD-helicase domain-containing protein [Candidatus Nitronereus thalassa]|uniref:DNA 3'-5' helicase n=1 Tax=Candidatus Nitronereus thalassa TaxID=3020898 RepID=A0ABU3K7Z0_9BACT|nr:UvrD-helicase domain-containing protein [Candidatus Nitronereus thalassa]MDT7042537.1 UvrD-helicase domain-containing protein [Candidatus Nitronereus thalassa]
MMHTLELVRAGAGSGKTTDLCQTVVHAVAGGLDPARILATTFTKKAAAELKGRIQTQLFGATDGSATTHRHADRLELAAIGTVHSVAHQVLSRYAIEMGLSPRLEVVTETASERALSYLLGAIPLSAWQPLADCGERLGINDLHRRILALLAAKRGNRINDADFTTQMASSADRVCELLSPSGVAAVETPISQLYDLADDALTDIDALTDDTQLTNKGRQKLRQLKSKQISLWGSYLQAIRITAGKRSGADGMLNALRTHASQVRQNPRLHADIRQFSSLLTAETIRLDSQYKAYKAERGLVDFTDLEILFLKLLEDESLSARLGEDFDLVLVDEFQDTNPLQLAIFRRLQCVSLRSRWVGDPKQAIYGFRDTDPALVNEIWQNASEATRTELPNNHRSQRGLVQFVGHLFGPIFGDDARQTPQKAALPRGVERWVFDTQNQTDDAIALACGIANLHAEGIRFGDIVILERTNRLLPPIATAFDTLGIPYLLESPGLLSTREGALILAGLRLVADRRDSLAAATVLHLLSDPKQDTPDWITERLQALRDTNAGGGSETPHAFHLPWEGDARFSRIENINRLLLSPTLVVQQVIEALDLPTYVQKWGDPAQRCSNLDSILRHAREYEEIAFDSGQAATLRGFILYLEELAGDKLDLRYPPQGHDAVTLMTYHSSKGLEWPVVVLSGLNSDRPPNMWSPVVTGGGQSDADPLEGRTLESWTWPFGQTEGQFGGLRTGSGLEDDALTSPEGQARTCRETEENLRLLYVGCTRAKHKLVFAHRAGTYAWLAQLSAVDSLLDCNLGEGEHELNGIDTSFVLRHLNTNRVDDCRIPARQKERWRSLTGNPNPPGFSPRFHAPSQTSAEPGDVAFHNEELPGPSYFPSGADEDHYATIGEAVHSYLAALPSMQSLSDVEKEGVAERCLAAFSVTGILSPSILVSSGNRFSEWVESKYPGAQWLTELSVTAPRSAGGQWNGALDLLLELTDGKVVIIDHKSAPIRREHCAAKATTFSGQLLAYKEMINSTEQVVDSYWIHFPLAGVMVKLV